MPPLSQLLRAIRHPFGNKPEAPPEPLCPVCASPSPPLDSVDFNKSCEEARGLKLPPSGERVEYRLCDVCGFCFAPQFARWSFRDFEERIYNDDYQTVDPDYERALVELGQERAAEKRRHRERDRKTGHNADDHDDRAPNCTDE